MTVADLIEELKKKPLDMEILINIAGTLKGMKVSELIDGLKQCNPDIPVTFQTVPKLEGIIE